MRLVIAVLLVACGGHAGPPPEAPSEEPAIPISVEWKVEQGEGNDVDVSLLVDGHAHPIGSLDAATEHEPGTPATCALRAASPHLTEIVCGDRNAFVAELAGTELVVSSSADHRREVKRIPVSGTVLAVKMLSLPFD